MTILNPSVQRLRIRLVAFLGFFRIINCLALGTLFIASKRCYDFGRLEGRDYLEAATWILMAAFAYAYNDVCDVEVDTINRPDRALPSGVISLSTAKISLVLLGVLIGTLTLFVWRASLIWPLAAMAAGVIYSIVLRKRSSLLSNITSACLVAAVPLSALRGQTDLRIWELTVGVMLLMFGREMQKDVVDYPGDQLYRPTPLLLGKRSRIFGRLYPLMLIASGILLYLATYTTHSRIGFTGSLALISIIAFSVIESVLKRGSPELQAYTLKFASYLLVVVLMIRGL